MFETNFQNITRALKTFDWVLSQLPPKQKQVMRWRFGFFLKRPKTLEEVGQKMNLSPERVRQIEAKALERIKEILKT